MTGSAARLIAAAGALWALALAVTPAPGEAAPADQRKQIRLGTDSFYRADLLWQPLDERTRNGFKLLWNEAGSPSAAAPAQSQQQ